MFNLVTDLIVIKVNNAVSPETCAVFRPSKSISITLTKEEQTVEFNFKSSLIISKDGNPMDPEYPCGEISFVFYVDLLKNTFNTRFKSCPLFSSATKVFSKVAGSVAKIKSTSLSCASHPA